MAGRSVMSFREPMPAELTIRPMVAGDVSDVAALEEAIYPQPWSVRVFEDELRQDGRIYRVAISDGVLVGYGGVMLIGEDAHVTTLAVEESERRLRLGTRLMLDLVECSLERGARHLTLEVRLSNTGAQRLYSRFGMAPVGVRKAYYRDEDALVMWATEIDGDDYADRLRRIKEALDG